MSRKRNKKYNPVKSVISAANVLGSRYLFACIGGKEAVILKRDMRRPRSVSKTLLAALLDMPHAWSVCISVILRGQDGKEYVQSQLIELPSKVLQHDISNAISKAHDALVSETNPAHFVNVAWIAAPNWSLEDFDDGVLYDKMGAFETLAKWEADKLGYSNCDEVAA